jgi:CRISPR/Cas system-associated exonuclease Cas4 (RecB family)
MVRPYYSSPRPTAGHHFSDLLICPQRAWLHYYGNPKDQVLDPAYLRALQQEGVEHEQAIYNHFFPDAIRIPEKRNKEERQRLTVEAMRAGTPAILQGYINTGDGVGVLDILEKVEPNPNSSTGYTYRVGEIKSSAVLSTAHVMQAAWYTELLERTQGQQISEACFFLRSGERSLIDLGELASEYEIAKAELKQIRESQANPGPHLIKMCTSCHWRSLCMPELIASDHLSLVPNIARRAADMLRENGVATWKDLKSTPDGLLEAIGLGNYEIELIRTALECLENGAPPLRQPLRPDAFQNLQVVTLEFPQLAEQRRAGMKPVPSAIHFETIYGQVGHVDVHTAAGVSSAELTPLLGNKKLAFYGGTDLGAFMQIARQSGIKRIRSLDIFTVAEAFVHSPVPGLELEALYSYITSVPVSRLSGPERVTAVREVISWVARSV